MGSAITGKALLASPGAADEFLDRGITYAVPCGGPPEGVVCGIGNDTSHIEVLTKGTNNVTLVDHSFYFAVVG